MRDFFYMGGYAFYVWAAFLSVAVVLIANVLVSLYQQRRVKQILLRHIMAESGWHEPKA